MTFEYLFTKFSDNKECALGIHNCHTNATCSNTEGSFICACKTEYSGNGTTCIGRQKIDFVV